MLNDPGAGDAALRLVQQHLEAIYQTEAPDVRAFQIDDAGLQAVGGGPGRGADEWVFVREQDDGLDLAVWVSPGLLSRLAAAPDPAAAVADELRALAAAVEGVSHFLLLIERARRQEPVSLLELEAQAEVDKFVCAHLHAHRRDPSLRHRLFRGARLRDDLDPAERERYAEAGRLADAWCKKLEALPHVGAVLDAQRRFWRAPGADRLDRLRRLAA